MPAEGSGEPEVDAFHHKRERYEEREFEKDARRRGGTRRDHDRPTSSVEENTPPGIAVPIPSRPGARDLTDRNETPRRGCRRDAEPTGACVRYERPLHGRRCARGRAPRACASARGMDT